MRQPETAKCPSRAQEDSTTHHDSIVSCLLLTGRVLPVILLCRATGRIPTTTNVY